MAKKSFPLRIDAEIHRALEGWAADELRSVNGHIEYLLREALKQAGRLPKRPSAAAPEPEHKKEQENKTGSINKQEV